MCIPVFLICQILFIAIANKYIGKFKKWQVYLTIAILTETTHMHRVLASKFSVLQNQPK
jgi:hypothetical protein